MKKRRFGIGKWNGVGGKLEKEESLEDGVIRETQEEICVTPKNFKKVAELSFTFPYKTEWNQISHVYFCEEWEGEPVETEEMTPSWFEIDDLPFHKMWTDDLFWLPRVIKGEIVKGDFIFQEGEVILEHKVEVVESF